MFLSLFVVLNFTGDSIREDFFFKLTVAPPTSNRELPSVMEVAVSERTSHSFPGRFSDLDERLGFWDSLGFVGRLGVRALVYELPESGHDLVNIHSGPLSRLTTGTFIDFIFEEAKVGKVHTPLVHFPSPGSTCI